MQLVSKIFNVCGHDPQTSYGHRQTDGQTTCNTALCTVYSASRGKNRQKCDLFFSISLCRSLSVPVRHCHHCDVLNAFNRQRKGASYVACRCCYMSLTIGQRAFSCSSPVIWNSIPLSVRNAPTISTFRRRLKSFYFRSLHS